MPGVHFDTSQLDKSLKRMLRRGFDMRPAWRQLRAPLRKEQGKHIDEQRGPDGKWRGLASSTRDRRLRILGAKGKRTKRGKIRKSNQRKLGRILSKRLTSRLKMRMRNDFLSATARGKWVGIHQTGGVAGKGSRIPAREYMYVSPELLQLTRKVMERELLKAWRARR